MSRMNLDQLSAAELANSLRTAGLAADLELMRACLAREEDLRQHLLEMLATDSPVADGVSSDSGDPPEVSALHAGHLLLAWRDATALPLFVEIFRDESRENLIEWFSPWLHEYGMAALAPFVGVVGDKNVHWYGRAAATEVLSAIGRRFPETKPAIIDALREALPAAGQVPDVAEQDGIWTWIAVALAGLDAEEALPQVEALFRAGLLEEEITGDLGDYRDGFGEGGRAPRPFNLLDVYRYLHKQVAYERAQRAENASPLQAAPSGEHERSAPGEPTVRAVPKVGRNDPCPCGSGRKYKRCHGRPGGQR